MEEYIPKSALVAEIEKLIKENELYLSENASDAIRFQKTGAYSVLCDLRHFIDTLEVKEINPNDAFIEEACDAYCAICDTKECEGCAECSWIIKFRRQLMKLL